MNNTTTDNNFIGTSKDLAEFLGVTERRVRQLAEEGVAIKIKKGVYDLKKSVNNYLNKSKEEKDAEEEKINKVRLAKEVENLSHEKLKKRKTELQVKQLEKQMHLAEDVEFYWNSIVIATKTRLLSIPVKAAPLVMNMESQQDVQDFLKEQISTALNEMAEYDINNFDSEIDDDEE